MEEHRQFTRFRFNTSATLTGGNQSLPVEVLDVSLKGALIRLPLSEPLPPAAGYSLSFTLPDDSAQITMLVSIVHQEDDMAGLICQHLAPEESDHLRHYIAFHADDEGLLQRELEVLLEQHKM